MNSIISYPTYNKHVYMHTNTHAGIHTCTCRGKGTSESERCTERERAREITSQITLTAAMYLQIKKVTHLIIPTHYIVFYVLECNLEVPSVLSQHVN